MAKAVLNTYCVAQACNNLKIPYIIHDEHGNCVEVHGRNRKLFFINFETPWNDDSSAKLCRDKEFTYRVLHKYVAMPSSVAFFDPAFQLKRYKRFVKHDDINKIANEICGKFVFPIIVKMNSGSKKRNVFLCRDEKKVRRALELIYDKKSLNYDYIAIAQSYVDIKAEYRVIIFKSKVLLIYTKHTREAKAVRDASSLKRIKKFIAPIFEYTNAQFAGLDIAIDRKGAMWLFEMNSCPGFDRFARKYGEKTVVKLYEKMLRSEK